MSNSQVIWAGEDASKYSSEIVGGKGKNLLNLYDFSRESKLFNVPNFFIIPSNVRYSVSSSREGVVIEYKTKEIEEALERLNKPVIVRSSYSLEDGLEASFAGMFQSIPRNMNYLDMTKSANEVYESENTSVVRHYMERMGIKDDGNMALIVQEEIEDYEEGGIIQLEENKAIIELFSNKRKFDKFQSDRHEIDYDFLDGERKSLIRNFSGVKMKNDFICEGDYYSAINSARDAAKEMGLEGKVQVEVFFRLNENPNFVQIRQLPKPKSHLEELDLSIPKNTPYIESEVCNDVSGEFTLPAYVSFSQSGFNMILIGTGQSLLRTVEANDKRADEFYEKSKLGFNHEFDAFINLTMNSRFLDFDTSKNGYEKIWKKGNSLFSDYVLVCDKLDESIIGMNDLTTNKRAIITCNEASMTSHAMTVARELDIICMGIQGSIRDLEPRFYHEVETGDLIKIKSNGKKAVAYIEKKRESDPYEISNMDGRKNE